MTELSLILVFIRGRVGGARGGAQFGGSGRHRFADDLGSCAVVVRGQEGGGAFQLDSPCAECGCLCITPELGVHFCGEANANTSPAHEDNLLHTVLRKSFFR